MKTLKVKRCDLGFGITDGKKWFAYAYPTQEQAEKILPCFITENEININISYSHPICKSRE
jgi:hypothetical protein